MSDLPKRDAPPPQLLPLTGNNVLIQDVHSRAQESLAHPPKLSGFSVNNLRPSSRASRAPSKVTRPEKCFGKSSSGSPSAKCSNNCQTMILVPLNVGLP